MTSTCSYGTPPDSEYEYNLLILSEDSGSSQIFLDKLKPRGDVGRVAHNRGVHCYFRIWLRSKSTPVLTEIFR